MSKSFTISKQVLNVRTISLGMIGILILSVMIQSDAFASILSANVRNAVSNTDIFSINNTSTTRYIHVDFNGKTFVTYGADFANSTTIFDSSKLCIRNPASTFTTCFVNSAVTANRSLTVPLITGTDTLETLGLAQVITANKNFTSGDTFFMSATPEIWMKSTSAPVDTGFWRFRETTGGTMLLQTVNDANTVATSAITITRTTTTPTLVSFGSDISVPSTNKVFLDGGGDTYLIESSANVLNFFNGGANNFGIDANANVIVGAQSNLTTSATNGFQYVRITTGTTPTGIPTTITGHEAMVFSGTSNKLCIYNGAWKCVTLS